jgi:hypothetical protein
MFGNSLSINDLLLFRLMFEKVTSLFFRLVILFRKKSVN